MNAYNCKPTHNRVQNEKRPCQNIKHSMKTNINERERGRGGVGGEREKEREKGIERERETERREGGRERESEREREREREEKVLNYDSISVLPRMGLRIGKSRSRSRLWPIQTDTSSCT